MNIKTRLQDLIQTVAYPASQVRTENWQADQLYSFSDISCLHNISLHCILLLVVKPWSQIGLCQQSISILQGYV